MPNVKPQNTATVYKKDIEAAKKRISAEMKNYGKAVDNLIKADKAHTDTRRKVDVKPSEKNKLELASAKKELAMAVYEHKAASDNLDLAVDDLQQKSTRLSRYYHSNGKIRKANVEKVEFEKYYETHVDDVKKLSKNSEEIVAAAFQSATVKKPIRAAEMFGANSSYEFAAGIPYPEKAEEAVEEKKEPITFSFEEGENNSRVTVDVTDMVEEAVRVTLAKFVAAFEAKVNEYISNNPLAAVQVNNISVAAAPAAVDASAEQASVSEAPKAALTASVSTAELSGKSEAEVDEIAVSRIS